MAVERLRGGYLRRAGHACVAARVRQSLGAARLEQQLRIGSEQGGLLPLLEPSETFFSLGENGFSGNHRRHRGQGKYFWNLRGTDQTGEDELRPLLHRRYFRQDARLRR